MEITNKPQKRKSSENINHSFISNHQGYVLRLDKKALIEKKQNEAGKVYFTNAKLQDSYNDRRNRKRQLKSRNMLGLRMNSPSSQSQSSIARHYESNQKIDLKIDYQGANNKKFDHFNEVRKELESSKKNLQTQQSQQQLQKEQSTEPIIDKTVVPATTVKKLGRGGGGFSLMQHNRFQRYNKDYKLSGELHKKVNHNLSQIYSSGKDPHIESGTHLISDQSNVNFGIDPSYTNTNSQYPLQNSEFSPLTTKNLQNYHLIKQDSTYSQMNMHNKTQFLSAVSFIKDEVTENKTQVLNMPSQLTMTSNIFTKSRKSSNIPLSSSFKNNIQKQRSKNKSQVKRKSRVDKEEILQQEENIAIHNTQNLQPANRPISAYVNLIRNKSTKRIQRNSMRGTNQSNSSSTNLNISQLKKEGLSSRKDSEDLIMIQQIQSVQQQLQFQQLKINDRLKEDMNNVATSPIDKQKHNYSHVMRHQQDRRPKTIGNPIHSKKLNQAINNLNSKNQPIEPQPKQSKKSLLSKSFRALSKNINTQQQSLYSRLLRDQESRYPPQFFTQQLKLDYVSRKNNCVVGLHQNRFSKQQSTSPFRGFNSSPSQFNFFHGLDVHSPDHSFNSPGKVVAVHIPQTHINNLDFERASDCGNGSVVSIKELQNSGAIPKQQNINSNSNRMKKQQFLSGEQQIIIQEQLINGNNYKN